MDWVYKYNWSYPKILPNTSKYLIAKNMNIYVLLDTQYAAISKYEKKKFRPKANYLFNTSCRCHIPKDQILLFTASGNSNFKTQKTEQNTIGRAVCKGQVPAVRYSQYVSFVSRSIVSCFNLEFFLPMSTLGSVQHRNVTYKFQAFIFTVNWTFLEQRWVLLTGYLMCSAS